MKTMAKKIFLLLVIIFTISTVNAQKSLLERLDNLSGVEVEKTETDTIFNSAYILSVEQLIDHNNPEIGTFTQRVFLSHNAFDKPVVFITEGYAAWYAANPKYVNELSTILDANQICVEHRYFGKSVPDSVQWKYLTTAQAAADHHHVVELLKTIYNSKWVNTGISKGGQTTIYHRYYYPNDVDASVGYVCPLNFSYEDKRVYKYFDEIGTQEDRDIILRYQKMMLSNKETFLPMFIKASQEKEYSYPFSDEKAFEFIVLEYPFAFWQWGDGVIEDIPTITNSDSVKFAHLQKISPFDYFSNTGIERLQPFFYQAMTEIGYYGYDLKPFGDLITTIDDNTFMFTLPKGENPKYDFKSMRNVNDWLQSDAEKMLFIYGENDPWSSTGVDVNGNKNIVKIVKPNGSHKTRIRNLPAKEKKIALEILEKWLDVIID